MNEVKETAAYHLMIRDLPQNERPRERLQHIGAPAVATAELIAIILRTGSGGENVLRLAERILHRFGDLVGIARASLTELQEVRGVGPAKAIEIKAALELGRRLTAQTPEERPRITCPSDAANLLMSEMSLLEQEHLRVLLLNTRNEVLRINTVYIGNVNTSVVRIAELFRPAIRENATSLILVHNHPSGDPSPSPEDVRVTREVDKAGKLLNIELIDHIIIGHNRFISLKERRLGFDG
jgi:DNA repair protein RadC